MQHLFVWVNRFSRQIGTLRDGMATDLMVVIIHTDILFSLLQEKDMTQKGKFPPQVISAYPVPAPKKNDSTKCE